MAVITISRQYGAGAMALGRMLAEKRGYTLASRDIVQQIADKAKVSTDFVLAVEKEAGTKLSRFMTRIISSRGMVNKILRDDSGYIDEKLYLDYLVLTVVQIADEGNAVIMGRGSQYILKTHPDAVHILLVDEFENRVNRVAKEKSFPTRAPCTSSPMKTSAATISTTAWANRILTARRFTTWC